MHRNLQCAIAHHRKSLETPGALLVYERLEFYENGAYNPLNYFVRYAEWQLEDTEVIVARNINGAIEPA